jgi:glyoxylase-like metal-dependent hydrolase (beta-lactamase superfamily II)
VPRLGEDIVAIPLKRRHTLYAFLLGDVLVDAGVRRSAPQLEAALRGRTVSAHALTHAHADHAGASARLAHERDLPVWVGAGDAAALAAGRPGPGAPLLRAFGRFDAVTPARLLREGDELGHGFVVLDAPGHTPGHVAFWRESDRALVVGDALFNLNPLTTRPGLREPPRIFSADPAANRATLRRLAALEPALVLFSHGPPLADPARLRAFAARLD